MIDMSYIQEQVIMNKRKEILANHKYKIWQGKDGRWYTHLPDEEKGRVLKKRNTKEEIENIVIDFYGGIEEAPCFREEYQRWIKEKEEFEEIGKNSITRYDNDFNRFFPKDEPFCKIKLCDMTDGDLERFIKRTIKKFDLSTKSYAMLRLILNGVFKYAKREGHTKYSISSFFLDLMLPKNIFKKRVINNSDQVFNDEEAKMLIDYFRMKGKPIDIGLYLQFVSGLRIGELAALKWEDFDGKSLMVHRTEIAYFDKTENKHVIAVKDTPKTEAGVRNVIIPEEAAEELLKLKETETDTDGFIFKKNGKRITERMFGAHLKKACRELHIKERSTHKVRKTYASNLLSKHIDEAVVARQMGHKQISTTHGYYHFDIMTDAERIKGITEAVKY